MKRLNLTASVIYGLVLVAASIAYFYLYHLPLLEKTELLDTQHTADVQQTELYQAYLLQKDAIEQRALELGRDIVTQKLKNPLSGLKIAEDINDGFKLCGIIPDSIQMMDETPVSANKSYDGQVLYRVPIKLSFNSDVTTLNKLLKYFETQSKGAYYVTNVDVSMGELAVSMNLSMDAYYYASQEEIIKSAPIPKLDNEKGSYASSSYASSSSASEKTVSSAADAPMDDTVS